MNIQHSAIGKIYAIELSHATTATMPQGLSVYFQQVLISKLIPAVSAEGTVPGVFQTTSLSDAISQTFAQLSQLEQQYASRSAPQATVPVNYEAADPLSIAADKEYPLAPETQTCGPIGFGRKPYSLAEAIALINQWELTNPAPPPLMLTEMPTDILEIDMMMINDLVTRLYVTTRLHEHVCCSNNLGVWINTVSMVNVIQTSGIGDTVLASGMLLHDTHSSTLAPFNDLFHTASTVIINIDADGGVQVTTEAHADIQWTPKCDLTPPITPLTPCCCDEDRTRLVMLAGVAGIELAAAKKLELLSFKDTFGPLFLSAIAYSIYSGSCSIKPEWLIGLAIYAAYRLSGQTLSRSTGDTASAIPSDMPIYV